MVAVRALLCAWACAAPLVACGGGDPAPPALAVAAQVALYGDSLTVGRTGPITAGAFTAADYAVWGQSSAAPLVAHDTAPVVVIRYGMADAILGMPPGETLANVQALAAQVRAQGRRAIVVGLPCLEGTLGAATAAALRPVADLDVTPGCTTPLTTDGIHPTPAEHARMDALIRAAVLAALHDAGP